MPIKLTKDELDTLYSIRRAIRYIEKHYPCELNDEYIVLLTHEDISAFLSLHKKGYIDYIINFKGQISSIGVKPLKRYKQWQQNLY